MKKFSILLALLPVIMAGCKTDPISYSDGQFVDIPQKESLRYVEPNGAAVTSSLLIGSAYKASENLTMKMAVVKSTNPAHYEILTDLNNVTIPQGEVSTTVQVRVPDPSVYSSGATDTLVLKVVDSPYGLVVDEDSTMTFIFTRFCSIENMDDWNGYYVDLDAPGYEMKVTHIGNDTLRIENFWGESGNHPANNSVIKIIVNHAVVGDYKVIFPNLTPDPAWNIPAKLPAATPGGQYMSTWPPYGPVYLMLANAPIALGKCSVEFCYKTITLSFWLQIPNYLTGGYHFTAPADIKMQWDRPLE
ncbi:MAG: hypothetical protein LBR65_06625 [Culturomica sp.]|jgi:hypothetical protein|nr:hypothetical protein [Culturomica sp.]